MRPAFVAAVVAAAAAGMPGGAALAAPPAPYHLLFSADRDGDLDVYASSVDGRGAVAVTHNSVKDTEPLLSPDGRSVAVRRGPDVVVLSRGRARVVAQGEPGVWSPDGRRLAVGGPRGLALVDLQTGSVRRLKTAHGAYFEAWSPQGDKLEYEDADVNAFVIDLASGRRTPIGVPDEGAVLWSASGRLLAYSGEGDRFDPELVVRTVDRDLIARAGWESAWSPRGEALAYVVPKFYRHPGLHLLDVRTHRTRQLATGPVGVPAWSPTGDRIAYARNGVVKVVGVDGGRPRALRGSAGALTGSPSWSPDGRRIAFVTARGIVVGDTRGGPAHLVGRGRRISIIGWGPGDVHGPRAPLLGLPPVEEVRGSTVLVRGRVTELSAHGSRVAFLVEQARTCKHAVVWRPGTRGLTTVRPNHCRDWATSIFYDLELSGRTVIWGNFYCGNDCYESSFSAVVRARSVARNGSEQDVGNAGPAPKHVAPTAETVRGVSARLARGILHVSTPKGLRIIRPAAAIVDFDLTPAGLFYAYDLPSGQARGRVVFVPRARLR
jgi:dipeptidyl aminopeptidase/acylaminoacyl peptidase